MINAGKGYEANPDLKPSPRHHGMRDYQRYLNGTLQDAYLARTPTRAEPPPAPSPGTTRSTTG